MDPRTQASSTDKQELVKKLANYRSTVKVPDTRQLLSQSKNLLQVAGRFPSTIQNRPARTLMITAGVSCLLVLLLKPKRKQKQEKTIDSTKTISQQLLAFSLSMTQPIARVWLTEKTRKWLQK